MNQRSMTREEVRDLDRRAIDEYGLPGIVLMENAGRGCAELIASLGVKGPVVIVAGKGNNGGDGYVIARHLENCGYTVRVLMLCNPQQLKGDALTNYRVLETSATDITVFDSQPDRSKLAQLLDDADWIVDAMLGTGTQGEIREPYVTAIEAINAATAKVLAVDVPSGMDCDTGKSSGCCVKADHTATFVARKVGFDMKGADELTGTVHVIDIGIPQKILA